jgi:hypothetical protein
MQFGHMTECNKAGGVIYEVGLGVKRTGKGAGSDTAIFLFGFRYWVFGFWGTILHGLFRTFNYNGRIETVAFDRLLFLRRCASFH